ncbi:SGNH/GDSL hydrolase family protein [Lentisphaera profundi]|uniref:SGNH/GDSL hydrolase family protein n=1 Tax=Lentisphaera profundi TaxID=1658616 RepID=A0ABY7VS66_9BACT|nr:SGNH/GDSL hydrolase family protein [Lentisphaera profundi]WDE96562.1 SGNH/GDSL hydrolase family protein [Lentisphaera profundi]
MKQKYLLLLLTLCSYALIAVEQGSFEEKASSYSWACSPVEGLPNVLLVGDSISIGYTLQVRQYLKGKANLYRPMTADGGPQNGGDAAGGKRSLKQWLGKTKWDIIHFNWGLHDLKRIGRENGKSVSRADIPPRVSIEQYKQDLQDCIDIMKQSGAQLIFASTTAYPSGVSPVRLPEDANKYNTAAQEVMTQNSIPINDLYALTVDRLKELQSPKNVHFTELGSAVIGKQVASAIASKLGLEITLPPYNTASEALKAGDAFRDEKKYDEALKAYKFSASLATGRAGKFRPLKNASELSFKIQRWDDNYEVNQAIMLLPKVSDRDKIIAFLHMAKMYQVQENTAKLNETLAKIETLGELPPPMKKLYSSLKK